MKVGVTGAAGFVGRAIVNRLLLDGDEPVPVVRTTSGIANERVVGDLLEGDWKAILRGCDAVVHTAARVHVLDERASDPLAAFRRTNRDGALAVLRGAAAAGVRRMVHLSSIKVNGDGSPPGQPYHADSPPMPEDPYGLSKAEAEAALSSLAPELGVELVIVRPPLVHGPGVKANFLAMMRALDRRIPLPFAAITDNRRSLVGLDNLVDLIAICLRSPQAAHQLFLVSDGEDMSTAELLRRLGAALGKPARLISVPPAILRLGASLGGRGPAMRRLTGNLQVDIAKNSMLLGWTPPVTLDEGFRRAAEEFRRKHR